MPKARTPLIYTNAFKLRMVLDYLEAAKEGMTRMAFCKLRGIKRPTLQTWERKLKKLVDVSSRQGTKSPFRASRLTVGGSGRVSPSAPIEDALVTFVKDARREEQIVTRDMIDRKATDLLPDFMESKSYDAQMSWCERFMRRRGLTMQRISHSGRKTRSGLEEARLGFVYYNMGSRSTVDFVGATCIPAATEGTESYRCTMALTVAADGRKFPPHFVFQGQPGGDVEQEFRGYCESSVATFSVQAKAWFDLQVMLDWIENVWKGIVTEPSVLILDSLRVHKMSEVLDALACTGTAVIFVPGGCTDVAQPLDAGVMSPLKQHMRNANANRQVGRPPKLTPAERRRRMYDRAMEAMNLITEKTVRNAFHKAGPFVPYGPPLRG